MLDTQSHASRRGNLPIQLTSFVGRERELAEVERLLSTARLVTLIGAPGIGKTRLALQVAARMVSACPDGLWVVELAGLADPDLVTQSVASALGVREQPSQALIDTLTDGLRSHKLLIVLDNCEHLVGSCATLADSLLQLCPGVRMLATSREPLRVAGETTWRVPALSVPGPPQAPGEPDPAGQLMRYESARLFVERARAIQPSFALTARDAAAVATISSGSTVSRSPSSWRRHAYAA